MSHIPELLLEKDSLDLGTPNGASWKTLADGGTPKSVYQQQSLGIKQRDYSVEEIDDLPIIGV